MRCKIDPGNTCPHDVNGISCIRTSKGGPSDAGLLVIKIAATTDWAKPGEMPSQTLNWLCPPQHRRFSRPFSCHGRGPRLLQKPFIGLVFFLFFFVCFLYCGPLLSDNHRGRRWADYADRSLRSATWAAQLLHSSRY